MAYDPSQNSQDTPSWETRLPPEQTRPFGVGAAHVIWYQPAAWPGQGPTVSLTIPECHLQCVVLADDGTPLVLINRSKNKKIKKWLRSACEMAAERHACLLICCDTVEQAASAAEMAAQLLPKKYQRIAIERLSDPAARSSKLN